LQSNFAGSTGVKATRKPAECICHGNALVAMGICCNCEGFGSKRRSRNFRRSGRNDSAVHPAMAEAVSEGMMFTVACWDRRSVPPKGISGARSQPTLATRA